MTEDDAKRAAMGGDWETVARWLVRQGLARESQKCGDCTDEATFYEFTCSCGKRVHHSRSDWNGPGSYRPQPVNWESSPRYDDGAWDREMAWMREEDD
jgi:hypothetical protein